MEYCKQRAASIATRIHSDLAASKSLKDHQLIFIASVCFSSRQELLLYPRR